MNNNNNDLREFVEYDIEDDEEEVQQPGLAVVRVVPPVTGGVINNIAWTGGPDIRMCEWRFPRPRTVVVVKRWTTRFTRGARKESRRIGKSS